MPERSAGVLTVNMHEAKSSLSQLVRRAQSGGTIIIARDGRPAVRLTPVVCPDESAPFDILKGQLRMLEGFDEPIVELEAYL